MASKDSSGGNSQKDLGQINLNIKNVSDLMTTEPHLHS